MSATRLPAHGTVPTAAREQFEHDGFAVLERAIDAATLAMLREECAVFAARTDRWLANGVDVFGITLQRAHSKQFLHMVKCKPHMG